MIVEEDNMGELALVAGSESGLFVLRSGDEGKTWAEPEEAIAEIDAMKPRLEALHI